MLVSDEFPSLEIPRDILVRENAVVRPNLKTVLSVRTCISSAGRLLVAARPKSSGSLT